MRALAVAALITVALAFAPPSASAYMSAPGRASAAARASDAGHASDHDHASRKARRMNAFFWARRQAGKPYEWGGTGPGGFDCSGLVYAAYRRAGIRLPRTTYGMLRSHRLIRIRASQAKPGDLAFYGSGHVELVDRRRHSTFGALDAGTVIGWHQFSRWWHPTAYYRVRGAD